MIRKIKSIEECRDFAAGCLNAPGFSDPGISNEKELTDRLGNALGRPEEHLVLGVFREEQMIGLFVFLLIPEENYMEMLIGLSQEREAYQEILQHLEQHYGGFSADFVFSPANLPLKELLEECSAEFDTEQQKMVLGTPLLGVDTTGVELLSEKYAGQYCAIHNQDLYWTGERVLEAPERFRTFLAVQEGKVVGYLDVTHPYEENEPFDLYVLEEYRRMGYGRKLLAEAVERNMPKGMMLLVDVDNVPAISLYESMGFAKVQGKNNLTAHWEIPASL